MLFHRVFLSTFVSFLVIFLLLTHAHFSTEHFNFFLAEALYIFVCWFVYFFCNLQIFLPTCPPSVTDDVNGMASALRSVQSPQEKCLSPVYTPTPKPGRSYNSSRMISPSFNYVYLLSFRDFSFYSAFVDAFFFLSFVLLFQPDLEMAGREMWELCWQYWTKNWIT